MEPEITKFVGEDPPDDDDPACELTIAFTALVFAAFYGSLIAIIAVMYCKYRRELAQMA